MDERSVTRTLDTLLYLNEMTVRLYDDAAARVSDDVSKHLAEYRDDHQRHAERLREIARKKGRQPEEPAEDTKALASGNAQLVRNATGEDAVMEALLVAARTNAALYETAEGLDLGHDALEIIAEQHADERRHVEYITQHAPQYASVASGPQPGGKEAISCLTGGLTDDRSPDDFE